MKSRKRSRAVSPQRKRLVSATLFFVNYSEDILNVCPLLKDAIWSNQFDNRED
jgi:hypothetical protein